VRAFADTNVIVYAQSDDGTKTATAIKLLEAGPVISAQVVNEAVAILTRKYRFSL
jgi:predicted nucleic acid-binding protein